jgi:hypothetical protein
MMMNRRIFFLALTAAASTPACDKTPAAPAVAGPAVVSLTSPNDDDGGLLITLKGPGVSAVQSASSDYLVYWRLAAENEIRILVLGELGPGPLVTAQLDAVNRLSDYSASIEQVATRGDALRAGIEGYELRLAAQQ